jgi:helix-turn-helix protein
VNSSDRIGVDAYVFDALMPDLVGHDRRPAAFLVFLYLWRKTRGGTRSVVISLSMLTDGTGLSKRSVQTALQHLERRDMVHTRRSSPTAAPAVTLRADWRK